MKKIVDKYNLLPIQLKASIWFLICSFLQKGISMITTPIFTRIMSTSDYGHFGVFNSWLGIVTIFTSLNLSAGVHSQGIIKFSEKREQFTSSLAGLTTTLIVFWTVIYSIFQDFWNSLFSLSTIQMIAMLIIIWSNAIFNFWANEQRVVYSYRTLIAITLIVSVVKPSFEIILILHSNDKVTARIIGWVIVDFLAYLWLYISQTKKGQLFYSREFWKYALHFNLPLVPHYLSQTVLSSADRIMIQRMIGPSESGIYSLAYSISLIMLMFNNALMQTISPWMYKKIKDGKIKEIEPIAYTTMILIAIVNLLLILAAPEALLLFAPKEYHEAIRVIPPIAMSVYFLFCYDLFAKFAFYYEKTRIIMAASVSGATLNVILNYLFINKYGYIAAGYTTLVCYVLYSVAHYIFMCKVCREFCGSEPPYRISIVLVITISFLVIGFLLLATYNYIIIRYSLIIIIIVLMLWKRKKILSVVYSLLALRKNSSNL